MTNGLRVKRKQKFPIPVEKNGVTVPVHRVRSGKGYFNLNSKGVRFCEDGLERAKPGHRVRNGRAHDVPRRERPRHKHR